jgi:hypothetical protein
MAAAAAAAVRWEDASPLQDCILIPHPLLLLLFKHELMQAPLIVNEPLDWLRIHYAVAAGIHHLVQQLLQPMQLADVPHWLLPATLHNTDYKRNTPAVRPHCS